MRSKAFDKTSLNITNIWLTILLTITFNFNKNLKAELTKTIVSSWQVWSIFNLSNIQQLSFNQMIFSISFQLLHVIAQLITFRHPLLTQCVSDVEMRLDVHFIDSKFFLPFISNLSQSQIYPQLSLMRNFILIIIVAWKW